MLAAIGAMLMMASASAADLAARPYVKAPVAPVAMYNWAGFYLGLNGGGASSHNCWDINGLDFLLTGTIFPISPAVREGCHDATGALVGGQIGYRWQASNWVFGLEAQGDWANLKGSNVSPFFAAFGGTTNQTKIDAIGLFTGQIGYAWNNVLWYVKGGAAVTHNKYNGFVNTTGLTLDQANETRWGGTVGTGLEFSFAPRWSVGIEYDHLFMGSHTVGLRAIGTPTVFRTDNIKQDVDMGTVRLNYTFGGPVVAKY